MGLCQNTDALVIMTEWKEFRSPDFDHIKLTLKQPVFRFHDLRHTWASWHRQAGTSCDELKDLGGWKSRIMVDRYASFRRKTCCLQRLELRDREEGVTCWSCHVFVTLRKTKGLHFRASL